MIATICCNRYLSILLSLACVVAVPSLAVNPRGEAAEESSDQDAMIGIIYASRTLEPVAEFGGRVDSVAVELGTEVVTGDVLVCMDTQWLLFDMAVARAQRASAEAQVALLRVEEAMYDEQLRRRSDAPDAWSTEVREEAEFKVDKSRAELARAEAELAAEQATVAQLQARIDQSQIRAPFIGVVTASFVEAGDLVPAGASLLRMISIDQIAIRFGVPERLADELRAMRNLKVNIKSLGLSLETSLARWSPEIDPATGMFTAETELLVIDSNTYPALAGLAADVYFE